MENNTQLIADLKLISSFIQDDYPYTQQKTEPFNIDIVKCGGDLIKVIISHQERSRSKMEEWHIFANSIAESHFFKEYYKEIKKIAKKYNYRTHIPKIDRLEIQIIKKYF